MIRILMAQAIATLLLTLSFNLSQSAPATLSTKTERLPLIVFLVRHGEKADLSRDAELSQAGVERAVELSKILRSTKLDHVHSSDYIRTRNTAAPTAAEQGVEVELYDPQNLSALAENLLASGGNHLVVGHSTTTPELVELLGGQSAEAIHEEGEFDRLYVVMVGSDGSANSAMLRYGRAYDSEAAK